MKAALPYLLSSIALAWATSVASQSLNTASKTINAERVRFVTDQQVGTVTITIDGVPIVRIDKTGVQVSGSIAYTGEAKDQPFPSEVGHAR